MKSRSRRELIDEIKQLKKRAAIDAERMENLKSYYQAKIDEWRSRLEVLENDSTLVYDGITAGVSVVRVGTVDINIGMMMRKDKCTMEEVRRRMARCLADELIDRGLMRMEFGGVPDPISVERSPYGEMKVVGRVDVIPWERLVRKNEVYQVRYDCYPLIYEDMRRNIEFAESEWEERTGK